MEAPRRMFCLLKKNQPSNGGRSWPLGPYMYIYIYEIYIYIYIYIYLFTILI